MKKNKKTYFYGLRDKNTKKALPSEAENNEHSHIKTSFTYTKVPKRNLSNKSSGIGKGRVLTPIEAERLRAKSNGYELDSGSFDRMQRKIKKAKRTLVLKPAPLPPTASKNRLYRFTSYIWSEALQQFEKLDYFLLAIVLLLAVIGILAVHSATLTMNRPKYDIVQIGMTVVGFAAMYIISFIDYEEILKYGRLFFIINFLLLLLTVFIGKGETGETNKNWIYLGPLTFQPAEIGKIMFIISFSAHLNYVKDRIDHILTVLGLLLHAGAIIGLIMLQKDLGQSIVYLIIFTVMCYTARLSLWYIIAGAGILTSLSPVIWRFLNEYQQKRLLVGFNPELDPLKMGYQVIKSKTAIAAGGVTGLGYGKGLISQTELLPAKHTDMIFAVIGEESGLIGALVVLVLLSALIIRVLYICAVSSDMTGSFLCSGIAAMLFFQTIENVGMCLGFLPVIGITLPFLSSGGSSLLNVYVMMGIVLSVYTKKDTYFFNKQ